MFAYMDSDQKLTAKLFTLIDRSRLWKSQNWN